MRQLCVQTQQVKRTRPAPSKWQDGGYSTKSSKNGSQRTTTKGTVSQEGDIRSGVCFYCSRTGHQVKDCWLKNKLCVKCGETGHIMKNCTRDSSQQTANRGTPSQGRNLRAGGCTHCGRADHLLRNCWKWNGWCLRCGASDPLLRDCPERQGAVPMGPTGSSEAAVGPSQRGGKGKGIMRGKFHSYSHHT
ncbi:zf-CCHC domain-containing protein [Cephalotus follicularis]|uniref:Zf-CCHC domain-containing protein n=1 Tax=Cephalotus follicularis TaxID=3775 RepID=A0A1Q3DBD8_CEPFO|nr:zf-CCHC domain-containing protein [Cephalotus follicularis]